MPNEDGQAKNPLGQKPRSIDEAAFFSLKRDELAREKNLEEGRRYAAEMKAREEAREAAANRREAPEATQRRFQETAKPGPAERMVGDGLQNTPDRVANVLPADPKLTAAQLEMKAKREEARRHDREVLQGKREPEWKPELSPTAPSRSR